ncbi:SHOCT domain-containing protein [Cellulosimicrobium sp. Marseille-Q4280]|uniref:SHOCT domain-containing protein n=1 Tax=Cellulosimicrobium sp. Marseille-Q4280 TaxID=2937992 RepID=UPI00203EBF04|nr:SHOCT domain-containing protein [Cellulosimicrobium sp. Marseille-Q4280]
MDDFWSWFWLMVWWFFFIAYLIVLFQILGDLFRDKHLSGWLKALWVVALILVPYLSALVYLIARGRGMAERHAEEDRARKQIMDDYVRATAGSGGGRSATAEIADAKALYDAGTIDAGEFAQLKAKALA